MPAMPTMPTMPTMPAMPAMPTMPTMPTIPTIPTTVQLFLGYAGFCYADRRHALPDLPAQEIRFYALVGLIRHPEHGWVLYDTGYTRRFYAATRRFPYSLYARMTRVVVSEADELPAQLAQLGIAPADIRHVILTHFHADHIGGLHDFPNATVYCSRPALAQVRQLKGVRALRRGILPELIPEDFAQRVRLVEEHGRAVEDPIFGTHYDLFHDGTIRVYPLPGHAAGQIGIGLTTPNAAYFLAADACWLREGYQEMRLPSPLVKLFFDSWSDYRDSLARLHRFHRQHPAVRIVPTHCYETTRALNLQEGRLHEV